MALELV